MNIDDPKFTAYALDALSPEEKEMCEPDVLANADSLREAELTAAFAEKLKSAFTAETNARLSAAHWREIFAEAGVEQTPGAIPFEPEPKKRFPVWALSAAAGVMFGAVIASLAITWNDHPVLIADAPVRPKVNPVVAPVPVAPQSRPQPQRPAQSAATQAIVQKKSAIVASIPRPQVPPAVAMNDFTPPANEESVQPELAEDQVDVVAIQPEELPESVNGTVPSEFVANAEPDSGGAAPLPNRRSFPYVPTARPAMQSSGLASVPKPVVPAATQPAPPVAVTRPAISSSTVSSVPKKPAVYAFNSPPSKKVTVTIPNNSARKNGASISSDPEALVSIGSTIEQQLNTLRLGATLNDVNAAGFTPALSGFVSTASGAVSVGVPFARVSSSESDSAIFVNVVLDNNGLPLSLTPGDTKVLNVSDPYSLKLNP